MTESPRPAWPFLRRLAGDRRGAMAVVGAVGLVIVLAMSTVAVDMARVQVLKSRLQVAADAATLAAARDVVNGSENAAVVARAVFDANVGGRLAGGALGFSAGEVAATADGGRGFRIDATLRTPLTLGRVAAYFGLVGMTHATLTASSVASQRTRGAEVVLVLDNTGSMNGQKIADLRAATTALIGALYGARQQVPNLYVGVVPYSASVNVGRQHAHWLDPASANPDPAYAPTTWKGCVMARSTLLAETDAPPAPGLMFRRYLWPSSARCEAPAQNKLVDGKFACKKVDQKDAYHSKSPNVWPQYTKAGVPIVNALRSAMNNGFGPNLGCVAPIIPLTASRAVLDAAVPTIEAWGRGGTMANIGLAWGWRVISPRWAGLWRTPDGAAVHDPLPYDSAVSMKIVILMTDGENAWYQSDYTSYGRPGEMIRASDINPSMERLCTAIKAEGVLLFTITFGTGASNATIRDRYARCASSTLGDTRVAGPKYFHAPTGAQLATIFGDIAGQISDLRLVR